MGTVVVGAGQAGLASSYLLAARGREHVVLDCGRVGETWRSERWDGFCLNTRESALFCGVGEDAERVVSHLVQRRPEP